MPAKKKTKKLIDKSSLAKRNKIIAIVLVFVTSIIGAYFLFFAKADACSNRTYTVFQSDGCIAWIKGMVNTISGSSLDTANQGFDGALNERLLQLNGIPGFWGDCGNYAAVSGVNGCHYNKIWGYWNAKVNPPAPAPAPAPTPTPAPTPAPTAKDTNCENQNLKQGDTGNCVKWLKGVLKGLGANQLDANTNNFDATLNSVIGFTVTVLKNDGRTIDAYTGTVTKNIWFNINAEYAARQQATAPVAIPPTTTTTGTTASGTGTDQPKAGSGLGTNCPLSVGVYQNALNSGGIGQFTKDCHAKWLAEIKKINDFVGNPVKPRVPESLKNCPSRLDDYLSRSDLKNGTYSDCVKNLQTLLNATNKVGELLVDGTWDSSTEKALSDLLAIIAKQNSGGSANAREPSGATGGREDVGKLCVANERSKFYAIKSQWNEANEALNGLNDGYKNATARPSSLVNARSKANFYNDEVAGQIAYLTVLTGGSDCAKVQHNLAIAFSKLLALKPAVDSFKYELNANGKLPYGPPAPTSTTKTYSSLKCTITYIEDLTWPKGGTDKRIVKTTKDRLTESKAVTWCRTEYLNYRVATFTLNRNGQVAAKGTSCSVWDGSYSGPCRVSDAKATLSGGDGLRTQVVVTN